MFEKYPREEVEKIIFQRDYFKSRAELIRQFEDHIRKGFNAESCEEALKTLLRTTPSHPPVDPSEPSNLLPDTLWRIRCLKYLLSSDMYSDLDIINVNAVLAAYRTEKIHVNPSQCTVWYAGILVMGPVSCMKLKIEDYIGLIPEWREKYGPGQVWVEDVTPAYM